MLLVLLLMFVIHTTRIKVVRLFLDGGIGISSVKGDNSEGGFELGIKPGLAIKLNNHFSLVANVDSWDTEMIMRMVLIVTDFHSVVKTFHLVSITSSDKEPLYYNNKGKGGILNVLGIPFHIKSKSSDCNIKYKPGSLFAQSDSFSVSLKCLITAR